MWQREYLYLLGHNFVSRLQTCLYTKTLKTGKKPSKPNSGGSRGGQETMPPNSPVSEGKLWELQLLWLSVLTLAMIKFVAHSLVTTTEDNVQCPLLQELQRLRLRTISLKCQRLGRRIGLLEVWTWTYPVQKYSDEPENATKCTFRDPNFFLGRGTVVFEPCNWRLLTLSL